MAQNLLIGLGGTGSRVVNKVAKLLRQNGQKINSDGIYCAVLDTDSNDNKRIQNSRTGFPVIPTGRTGTIEGIITQYQNNTDITKWCPSSSVFGRESIVNGASEVRIKSRLALFDCIQQGALDKELGGVINQVLRGDVTRQVRVLIVSSIAGGSGSGMFIQVALWLRKHLPEGAAMIRGIFLLPDIFVRTTSVRNSSASKAQVYANAYAAIRELQAITKVLKGNSIELAEPIRISEARLFDSDRVQKKGESVYDFSFLIDAQGPTRVALNTLGEYEEMVAKLAYMQLFAPMQSEMYSVEDNQFRSIRADIEPLYGSCGIATAEYPVQNVKEYCVLRTVQETLTAGWRSIDDEIEARIEEKKQRERDGVSVDEVIDEQALFAELYQNKIEANTDRFFRAIQHDIDNEQMRGVDHGKINIEYEDKVSVFLPDLRDNKIKPIMESIYREENRLDGMQKSLVRKVENAKGGNAQTKGGNVVENLLKQVEINSKQIQNELEAFEKNDVSRCANAILDSIFPFSMQEVSVTDSGQCSVYQLLTKPESGAVRFIHPLAARYVLYMLAQELRRNLSKIEGRDGLEKKREAILSDKDSGFDNERTRGPRESTPQEFLKSKTLLQSTGNLVEEFQKKYKVHIENKIMECKNYETNLLEKEVCSGLLERVEALLAKYERFFKSVKDLQRTMRDDIEENIAAIQDGFAQCKYIFASGEDKAAVYEKIKQSVGGDNSRINKAVTDALYGSLCYDKRPSVPANQAYGDVSVSEAFYQTAKKVFSDMIDKTPEARDSVDLDIYSAMCREVDVRLARESAGQSGRTGSSGGATLQDYRNAFAECLAYLRQHSTPFLNYTHTGGERTRTNMFWGYNPAVKETFGEDFDALIEASDKAEDPAYPKNVLYCYQAVYGVSISDIPNFTEEQNGNGYFHYYEESIEKMLGREAGEGESARIFTPHLDKRWHAILPYIDAEKEKENRRRFYRGLWLAVAYGAIRVDKGLFMIRNKVYNSSGSFTVSDHSIQYQGYPLRATNVAPLIEVLKQDQDFMRHILPEMEEEYQRDLNVMTTYEGTRVLQGLTQKENPDLNPVTMILRCYRGLEKDNSIHGEMIGALEKIAEDLAVAYQPNRNEQSLKEAQLKICRRIYDACTHSKDRREVFTVWLDGFKEYGIGQDVEDNADE